MNMLITTSRAISTWYHQDFTADYAGVMRPIAASLGGNAALHYLQLTSNMFGLDTPESRMARRTNARNWLRATGRAQEMELRTSRGGFATPNAVSPHLTRMTMAAMANDAFDFRSAWMDAVRAARAMGKEDPEGYVRQAFGTRHPLQNMFRTQPSTQEFNRLLAVMNPNGRMAVTEAIRLHNYYATTIGGNAYTGNPNKDRPKTGANPLRVPSAQSIRQQVMRQITPQVF
jgi:hypothetical protein